MTGKMDDLIIDLGIGSTADLLVHKNSRGIGIAKKYSDNFFRSGGIGRLEVRGNRQCLAGYFLK